MGVSQSINKICFEDMKYAINNNYLIINTLPLNKQDCLIKNTIKADEETDILNNKLKTNISEIIIIYGENSQDDSVINKNNQLRSLGFINVYVYQGGLFEWLLLQDIYGFDLFETTSKKLDHLKYVGIRKFGTKLIEY